MGGGYITVLYFFFLKGDGGSILDEWGYILSVMCVFVFLKAAPPPPPCWNGNHVVVAILDKWVGGLGFFYSLSLSHSLSLALSLSDFVFANICTLVLILLQCNSNKY